MLWSEDNTHGMLGLRTTHVKRALQHADLARSFRTAEVVAGNEIPHGNVMRRPALFIINTDPNFQCGLHWITVYLPKSGLHEFIDPLGSPPSSYSPRLVRFLRSNSSEGKYIITKRKIQRWFDSVWGLLPALCLHKGHRCWKTFEWHLPRIGRNKRTAGCSQSWYTSETQK